MAERLALVLSVLLLALGGGVARAGEESKAHDAFVDLSTTPVPVVVDGRLVNYVFISARLKMPPGADGAKVRAQEPFIRDTLVREGSRHPFTVAGDPNKVDEARICALVRSEAVRRLGPGVVQDVVIVSAAPRSHLPNPRRTAPHAIVP